MLRKICAFMALAGFMGINCALAEKIQQSITSEVFYNTADERVTEYVDEPVEYNQGMELNEMYSGDEMGYDGPVWPMAGSDADVEIACGETGCGNNSSTKIVTRVGSGLVIENNINTKGDGWTGGPNIMNDAPIPAGFDYECTHNAEFPLMRREMMEDDGGTVLAVSRSP